MQANSDSAKAFARSRPAVWTLCGLLAVLSLAFAWDLPAPATAAGTESQANVSVAAVGEMAEVGSEEHKLPIDVATPCFFILTTSSGDVELVMTSPSGARWSSHSPAGENKGGHFDAGILDVFPSAMSTVSVEVPEPGEWTATVIVHSMPDSVPAIVYVLQVSQNTGDSGPVLHSLVPDRTYHRGEPVSVRVSLLEAGQPVGHAQLEAWAGFAGEEGKEFFLRDDGVAPDSLPGDGVYSAMLPRLSRDGIFQIVVTASRDASPAELAFQRTISQDLRVSRAVARLTGKYTDSTRDTDRDGAPDELVIGVGVHVSAPDSIGLMGDLSGDHCPAYPGRAAPRLLPAGDHVLEMVFPLKRVSRCGPGAFQLSSLVLFEENDPFGLLLVFEEPQGVVYRTRSYSADELIFESISPTGEATVQGIDENHDGRFEYLAVDMPIVLRLAGTYGWAVQLERDGKYVSSGNGSAVLPEGRSVMRFRFPGACLAQAPEGGRYTLSGLSMSFRPEGPPPAEMPRTIWDAPAIPLQAVPPPGQFESRQQSRNALAGEPDESYSCR